MTPSLQKAQKVSSSPLPCPSDSSYERPAVPIMFFKKQVEQLSFVLFCQLLLLSSAVPPMQELHVVTDFTVEDFRENKGSHD